MGLFKDIYCSHCGAKTNLLTRLKLKDGQYLCTQCSSVIPTVMKDTIKANYGIEEYNDLLEYIEFSNKILRPVFRETHSYYTIHIDTEHNLLYFGYGIDEKTVFFKFSNLAEFNLEFDAEELKEGILGDKVQGRILMTVKMADPYFYHEEILDYSAKAKAKKKLLTSRVEYENPRGMDEFIMYFQTAWQISFVEEENSHHQNTENLNNYGATDDLRQAMALFMIDSLENITLEDIKVHRNRLIKAFHPDVGSAADTANAQKINNAYEVLKQHISRNRTGKNLTAVSDR